MFRAFLAFRLNPRVEEEIGGVQAILKQKARGVTWVSSQKLHLTVRFFGEVEEATTRQMLAQLRRDLRKTEPVGVIVKGVGLFPNLTNPRVIWVGLEGTGLVELHGSIQKSLENLGMGSEPRPFVPHITIGRVKGRARQPELLEEIVNRKEHCFGLSTLDRVLLYRSDLNPGGSVYTVLGDIPLGEEA